MPDWGTLISDSKGILHDVAKESFDNLTSKIRQPLNTTNHLLSDTFSKTYKTFQNRIKGTLGIDIEGGVSLENIGAQLSEQLKNKAVSVTVESALGFAASKAAQVEGPLGLLLGEAVSVATGEFALYFMHKQDLKPGTWVFLDYGSTTRQINENPTVIELREGYDILGSQQSYAIIPDDLDYSTQAKHAIGFILGAEENGYEWSVFSFLSGKEEKIHEEKIRRCPEDFATKLDKNKDFSSVREVLFMKDHDPTLRTYLPTEPGTTVWVNDDPCIIIEQAGSEWVLERADGTQILAHESDLTAGRTETNVAWNHDVLHLGAYNPSDTLYSGEWVWIPAGDLVDKLVLDHKRRLQEVPAALKMMGPQNKVLAMVKSIEGKTVHLVRAYDGVLVDSEQPLVFGATKSIQGLLNKEFSGWKHRTLGGHNPRLNLPSRKHPMLTLGLGEFDDEELQGVRMAPTTKLQVEQTDTGGFEPVKEFPDAGKSWSRLETKMADFAENEAYFNRDRPIEYSSELLTQEPSVGGGSGSALMIVVGLGIAWAVLA